MILDLSKPGTSKNGKSSSILEPKEKKLHLCSWKYFCTWNKHTLETFNGKTFSEIFFSKTLNLERPQIGIRNKNFTDKVENSFLSMVDTFLKLPLQKINCGICHCYTVTYDPSQTWCSNNTKIQVFWGKSKEDIRLCR